jgi:hypothetical protein
MFGPEHVIAEIFWNAAFIAATYVIARGRALRKAHRYIDDKHGIKHADSEY